MRHHPAFGIVEAVRRAVAQVSPTDATVLVVGECTGRAARPTASGSNPPPWRWAGYIQLNADRVKLLKPAGMQVTEKLPPLRREG